jgi:serine/threonine-protein kinase
MLTGARTVKVADFGIARAVSDTSGTATMAGTVIGTAQYLSPEQGRGESADVRSDLYSVGCMLYELLVGEPPFSGDTMVSIVFQHISEPATAPSVVNPDISADIDAIVLKALAKDPDDRYQSAAEMKADVESVLSGHPAAATALLSTAMISSAEAAEDKDHVDSADESAVERSGVGRPRARRLIATMTGLFFVMAAASAFGIYESDRPEVAAATTIEVPAVLGLSQVGAESLLRNAHLVPRFELVHGLDSASVDTVIRQIPEGGDITTIDSTVTVLLNLGPVRQTAAPSLVAHDGDFRPWISQPSAHHWQQQQTATSHQTGESEPIKKESKNKPGKGKKGK